tara:strand:- start:29423 stop:30355 length:933 start_codon:yes stop_codon:yes gene_type:complete
LHVNALLTNISIGYRNQAYIADQLFPIVRVNKQADIVPKYGQSHWFRDNAKVRAPGTKSEGGGYAVDTSDSYFCNRWSRRFEIPDELRRNADAPWNLDRDATVFVTDKIQMRREVAFATDFFTTSVWGTDKTGATDFTKWSDYGASTPLQDTDEYKDAVEALVGQEPNRFAVGKQVHLQLKNHPALIDRIKYTQRAQLTADLIASLMEFESYLVGRSIYTTTVEGTAEASVGYTRIWGKNALMVYVPSAPSLLQPAAGYTFVWQVVPNALQYIKRMRNEEKEIDIVEANSYNDAKATLTNAGLFLSAAVA